MTEHGTGAKKISDPTAGGKKEEQTFAG